MERDPTTTVGTDDPAASSERRVLLIVGEGQVVTRPLPDGAELVVGREPDCDVILVHPKISRRHAHFRGGPPIEIEDLGGRNGVRVAGRRLATGERLVLRPAEGAELGPFVTMVLGAAPVAPAGAPALVSMSVSDPTLAGVPEVARRVAQGLVNVIIAGETGAGKEVLARTLHQLSGRTGPFKAINCAALSESLLDSELFGHERGAFTGATTTKPGLFELARGGTLLLDEIGEIPIALQAKLLRVIETREVYHLGGVAPIKLDVRFMAASHRDLSQDVARGRFRQDLYFRLNGITLTVAPLRERGQGIGVLAEQLLGDAARAAGRTAPRLSARALALLTRHPWPGNVRELRTVLERATLVSGGTELDAEHILFDKFPDPEPLVLDDAARFTATAAAKAGNISAMARSLGTSRGQVRRLALRYGVDLERFRG